MSIQSAKKKLNSSKNADKFAKLKVEKNCGIIKVIRLFAYQYYTNVYFLLVETVSRTEMTSF